MYSPSNYSSTNRLDSLLLRMRIELKRTSTFRLVIIVITLHSIISLIIIHNYLIYYNDTYHGKHAASHHHSDKGKISIYSRQITNDDIDSEQRYKLLKFDSHDDRTLFGPRSINLLHSQMISTQQLSHIGWFNDHFRWDEKYQCFDNRWTLCDKIFIATCKPNSIRAIYQFVPFKLQSNIRHLYFHVRATAEQLIEQSNDGFYGMLALIEHIDDSYEIIRLKFRYESESWSIRVEDYRSSKTIQSVTIMLTCYGYSGIASFTDVRLTSESAGLDPIFSPYEICSWCTFSDRNLNSKISKHKFDYELLKIANNNYGKKTLDNHQITLVTQVSMDRLVILEQSLRTWHGPVSMSIYVLTNDSTDGRIQDWQRLYIKKKISLLKISMDKSTIIMVPSTNSDYYPINALRNMAIKMVQTRFMFLIDADFQPSPNMEENFLNTLNKYHRNYLRQHNIQHCNIAFIVPAFEYMEMPDKDDPIIENKDELIQMIFRDDPIIEPFRLHESNEIHGLTNYWKWYYTNEPYNISNNFYDDKYEPYLIVEKNSYLPDYDENLFNYDMNKVMHTIEMFVKNYTFQVLHNVWAIHFQHRSTGYYMNFLKNITYRLHNRFERFKIIERIINDYRIDLQQCHNRI